MRKSLLFLAMFCGAMSALAQGPASVIKPEEITMAEISECLDILGIKPFRFDVSEIITGTGYNVRFYIDEYKDGKLTGENKHYLGLGTLSTPIPTDSDERAAMAKAMPKPVSDTDTVYYYDKVAVIVKMPTEGDNKFGVKLDIYGKMSIGFPPLYFDKRDSLTPFYRVMPFENMAYDADKGKIPLVAVGESWYDTEYDLMRYCTDPFTPDMSNSAFKYSPQIYVLGLEFVKD